jgi:hypothetical protein
MNFFPIGAGGPQKQDEAGSHASTNCRLPLSSHPSSQHSFSLTKILVRRRAFGADSCKEGARARAFPRVSCCRWPWSFSPPSSRQEPDGRRSVPTSCTPAVGCRWPYSLGKLLHVVSGLGCGAMLCHNEFSNLQHWRARKQYSFFFRLNRAAHRPDS